MQEAQSRDPRPNEMLPRDASRPSPFRYGQPCKSKQRDSGVKRHSTCEVPPIRHSWSVAREVQGTPRTDAAHPFPALPAPMTDSLPLPSSSHAAPRAIPGSSASSAAADNGGNPMGALAGRCCARPREHLVASRYVGFDSTPRGIGRNMTVPPAGSRASRGGREPALRMARDEFQHQRSCQGGPYLNPCRE